MYRIGTGISIILICTCLFLTGCTSEPDTPDLGQKRYLGYVNGDSINYKFLQPDSLWAVKMFEEAIVSYNQLISTGLLSHHELSYAMVQLADASFRVDQNSFDGYMALLDSIKSQDQSTLFDAHYYIIKANALDDPKSAISLLQKSIQINPTPTAFVTMARQHRIQLNRDSLEHYLNRFFNQYSTTNTPAFVHMEANYLMAEAALFNRDHISALSYVEEGLNLANDVSDRAKGVALKAKILRKLSQLEASNDLITDFMGQNALSPLQQEMLLIQKGYNAISLDDSLTLHAVVSELGDINVGSSNIHRLQGSWFYKQQAFEKVAFHLEKVYEGIISGQVTDLVIINEVFYLLIKAYSNIEDFQKARFYGYQSMVFETTHHNSEVSWDIILSGELLKGKFSFFNFNLFGEVILKGASSKELESAELKNLLAMYQMIDSVIASELTVFEEEAILEFLDIGQSVYSNAIETCFLLYAEDPNRIYIRNAFRFIESCRGVVLMRDYLAHSKDKFENIPIQFRLREVSLKSEIAKLMNQEARDLKRLSGLLKDQATYFEEMKKLYPDYFHTRLNAVRTSLDQVAVYADSANVSFISYFLSVNSIYQLEVHPKQIVSFKKTLLNNATKSDINKIIEYTQNASYDGVRNNFRNYVETSSKIFKVLFDSIPPVNKLVISTNDVLDKLPFDALLTNSDDLNNTEIDYHSLSYLGNQTNIVRTSSINDHFQRMQRDAQLYDQVLCYAYSDETTIEQPGISHFKELPGSLSELNQLETHFTPAKVETIANKHLERNSFMDQLTGDYDIIHLGTHAISSTSSRLENKVFIRNSEGITDSIHGYEIMALDISADLVVLSACESAKGTQVVGEGTYSLSRAFQQAGVNRVVASLWKQIDYSAEIINNAFYQNIADGVGVEEALYSAKKSYLKAAGKYTSHPAYWAGVVVY